MTRDLWGLAVFWTTVAAYACLIRYLAHLIVNALA